MKLTEVDKDLVRKMWGKSVSPVIGGDPEFFISDEKGVIRSADDFLPGKHKPLSVKARGEGQYSRLFFDGIQGEMAVHEQQCREYFAGNIEKCWRELYTRIPDDHKVILAPAAKIRKSVLKNADPEARIFGCEPDFNAYTLSQNTPEMDASEHPYRYAGGHMHLGISSQYLNTGAEFDLAKTEEGHIRAIKFLDLMLTIPTMRLDNDPGSKLRRSKYGKAGCFRPTPYGIEYRTPSCWWLKSPLLVSLSYGLARLAWTVLVSGLEDSYRKVLGFDEETVRGTIDETDNKTADKMWKKMRAYIATSGAYCTNPLHMLSHRATDSRYIPENYRPWDGTPRFLNYADEGRVVYALAAFEYMRENGVHSVIDKDVKTEWKVGNKFKSRHGLVIGSYTKLRDNDDFMKFQDSLLKELY